MGYRLGVDLGTTWTAAATWRDGNASIASLGTHRAAVPSVVCLRPDGLVLTGDAAQRRALSEPEHIAREFKRRLGDPTPLIVAGQPHTAERLTGLLLADVIGQVSDQKGERPDELAIAHPVSWGAHKLNLLASAVSQAGWDQPAALTIAEPVAAATNYATQNRVAPGERICVYDLGGGTFDVAILERTSEGFAVIGRPDGLDHVGGLDIDAAVFAHVTGAVAEHYRQLDPSDAGAVTAIARLRQECNRAKETLSVDVDTVIPVHLPNHQTTVRITRSELEQLVRPALLETIEATRRAIRAAALEPSAVSRVLLVGGASRMPLVAQLIRTELELAPTIDAHPKHAIALGTALHRLPATTPGPAAESAQAAGFDPNKTVAAIPAQWAPPTPPPDPNRPRPPDPPKSAAIQQARPPEPPPTTPDDGRTEVADPNSTPPRPGAPPVPPFAVGHDGATSVVDPSATPALDPLSTTVFDPSLAARPGAGQSVIRSKAGSVPPSNPDATTVSPRPTLSASPQDEGPNRRTLLISMIVVMIAAGGLVLVLRPFERLDGAAAPSTTTTTTTTEPSVTGVAELATVPDLIGEPVDRAEIRLLALGFEVEVEEERRASEPGGTVIDQSVAGGEQTDAGATIVLTVSAGRRGLVVPDIVGRTNAQAAAEFREIGFSDVTVEREPSQTVASGTVVRVEPAAGTAVELDTPIVVVLSDGVAIATIPDVVGSTGAEAEATLTAAGFDVEVIAIDIASGSEGGGQVLSQSPTPGAQRVLPATVTIEVGPGT